MGIQGESVEGVVAVHTTIVTPLTRLQCRRARHVTLSVGAPYLILL